MPLARRFRFGKRHEPPADALALPRLDNRDIFDHEMIQLGDQLEGRGQRAVDLEEPNLVVADRYRLVGRHGHRFAPHLGHVFGVNGPGQRLDRGKASWSTARRKMAPGISLKGIDPLENRQNWLPPQLSKYQIQPAPGEPHAPRPPNRLRLYFSCASPAPVTRQTSEVPTPLNVGSRPKKWGAAAPQSRFLCCNR